MNSRQPKVAALFVFASLALTMNAAPGSAACPTNLPAGIVIRLLPDEKIIAGRTTGPTIFTVSPDVRFFPNRPPLIPRGSKVLGEILDSKDAGHFWGRAWTQVALNSLLMPDNCQYAIDVKIIEAGKYTVRENKINGRGHAKRDVFFLLFPPTTIYQLLSLPRRGPKLILDVERPIAIKLVQPVSLVTQQTPSQENPTPATTGQIQKSEAPNVESSGVSTPCPAISDFNVWFPFTDGVWITGRAVIERRFRNWTPYQVVVFLNHHRIVTLPPCSGRSTTLISAREFALEAKGILLAARGQKEVDLDVVVNEAKNGWDIVLRNQR